MHGVLEHARSAPQPRFDRPSQLASTAREIVRRIDVALRHDSVDRARAAPRVDFAAMSAPKPDEIAGRVLILKRVVAHELATPPRDEFDLLPGREQREQLRELDEGALELSEACRVQGLWSYATEFERRHLARSPLHALQAERIEAQAGLDALPALLFALGIAPKMPPYDVAVDPSFVSAIPNVRSEELLARAKPREPAELERAREVAAFWYWRSRTRQRIEDGEAPPKRFGDYAELVRENARSAHAEGLIDALVDDDVAVGSCAYRALDDEQFTLVTARTIERLRAFNWLCGRAPSNRWERTPLEG